MHIQLPYGESHVSVDLPDSYDVTMLARKYAPPPPDPLSQLRAALQRPIGAPRLHDLAGSSDHIGIVFNDITRPTPSNLIIHAILEELAHVPRENITLFNALGTHRPNTKDELRTMLGGELADSYRIVQNRALEEASQVQVGTTRRGHPVWLDREFFDCRLKILTGFIEPHFFAGFSGGGKAIMPGMAGLQTISANHDAQMIGDPRSTWGVTRGNPIWEEVLEVAQMVPGLFLLNVTLDREKRITGVYCGDLEAAHRVGCECVRESAFIPIDDSFEVVITTNSGYPLDLNLYQCVKGMSAAAQAVRPGGAIIVAAECRDGLPGNGPYGSLLKRHSSPEDLLRDIQTTLPVQQDQWQVQIQAMLELRADIYVHSRGLTEDQIRSATLKPCKSIEDTVAQLVMRSGPHTRIGILPEGPQTIPFLHR